MPTFKAFKCIGCSININGSICLFACIYIHPGTSVGDAAEDFQVLNTLSSSFDYSFIGGDFNARHQSWNNPVNNGIGRKLFEFVNDPDCNFVSPLFPPTYTRIASRSTIDFFLASPEIATFASRPFCAPNTLSDHQCVLTTLSNLDGAGVETVPPKKFVCFDKVDWSEINSSCEKILTDQFAELQTNKNLTPREVDLGFDRLINSIDRVMELIPTTTEKYFAFSKLPSLVQTLIKLQESLTKKLRKIFKRHLTSEHPAYKSTKSHLNRVKQLLKENLKIHLNVD